MGPICLSLEKKLDIGILSVLYSNLYPLLSQSYYNYSTYNYNSTTVNGYIKSRDGPRKFPQEYYIPLLPKQEQTLRGYLPSNVSLCYIQRKKKKKRKKEKFQPFSLFLYLL